VGLGLTLIAATSVTVGWVRPVQANPWPSPTITQPDTVTADVLPTVQINGVVWSQVVVGNTVYVGGSFSTARPAGVAQGGAGQVTRNNFLAYDLSTGQLLSSVVLNANAQVRTVTVSPDGSRVYVGGDFTSFGGQTRNRVAAIDTASNTVVANFSPNVGYHVYDVAATSNTVYVAGNFTNVGSQQRNRLAAFTTSGALLSWAPSVPDRQVFAIAVSPDGSQLAPDSLAVPMTERFGVDRLAALTLTDDLDTKLMVPIRSALDGDRSVLVDATGTGSIATIIDTITSSRWSVPSGPRAGPGTLQRLIRIAACSGRPTSSSRRPRSRR
jgi:hypothetical protein